MRCSQELRPVLTAGQQIDFLCGPQKTHVILSEVAERHEVEGSVFCGALHRAAYSGKRKRILRLAALAQNDKKICSLHCVVPPAGIFLVSARKIQKNRPKGIPRAPARDAVLLWNPPGPLPIVRLTAQDFKKCVALKSCILF